MTDHEPKLTEQPRIEEHRVFLLLALPIFAVTILIIILISTFGVR